MKNYAVIVAGGKSKRAKTEKNKCLTKLSGREVILWTIEALASSGAVEAMICVAADRDEVGELKDVVSRNKLEKIVQQIMPTEGPKRQEGVWTGIRALESFKPAADDIVLIHNGANPLVKSSEVKAGIDAAREYGASVLAMRVKDTIKRVGNDLFVSETLDRNELWAMQTPQSIRYSIAIEAFKKAIADNFYGTDDVQLVERTGRRVKIVECSYENIKLTTPEDFILAEEIIRRRGRKA